MGKKRIVKHEEYYTSEELVNRCVDMLESYYDLEEFLIIEPSAGGGAFLDRLKPYCYKALDITPRHPDIEKHDFFDYDMDQFNTNLLLLGNPPFGSRGSLALKFMRKAMKYANVVAFILPRSFNKYTFINRFDRNFYLVDSFLCDDFYDFENNEEKKVKSVFQIWARGGEGYERPLIGPVEKDTEDFDMFHVHISRVSPERLEKLKQDYPYAISQVGRFKFIRSEHIDKGSWWLIRPKDEQVVSILENLDFDHLKDSHTILPSLSRYDIIEAYNKK